MPSKQYIEAIALSEDELKNELTDLTAQYQKLKFDHTLKGLENPLTLREVRRDIARLHTEVRRRQIANMSPEQLQGRTKTTARRRKK